MHQQNLTNHSSQLHPVKAESCAEGVPQCAHHRIQQDGTQIVEEESGWHEVAGIAHDGGQQEEEEEAWVELVERLLAGDEDDATQYQTNEDEHAALRHHGGEALGEMEH